MPTPLVQEHQIKVRAIAEFDAAEFAVADDDKTRILRDIIDPILRPAMARHQMLPGQTQYLAQHRLGDFGEMIADHHQRHGRGDVGGGDAQHIGLLEPAQCFHLPFQIVVRHGLHERLQFLRERDFIQRRIQAARIEQFIEQDRMARELPRDPRTGGAQLHQLRQGHGIFHQQRQIGAAPGHRFEQADDALQGRGRLRHGADRADQHRQQMIHALTGLGTQGAITEALAQTRQQAQRFFGIVEPGGGQDRCGGGTGQHATTHRVEIRIRQ